MKLETQLLEGKEAAEAIPQSLADAITEACEAVSHNLNGQKLGRKGRITRERIIRGAIELLNGPEDEPFTLGAVASKASLGMTSLYNYFDDMTELLIAVLEPVMASGVEVYQSIASEYWADEELPERCQAFVDAYHAFWIKHSRLLHLRNSMSDHGDERMMRYRMDSTMPVVEMLVRQMGERQMSPESVPTLMMTMVFVGLERSVTLTTDRQLEELTGYDFGEVLRYRIPGARLLEITIRDGRNRERDLN